MGDDAPSFGCFNHNRKLSDETLRTWANLLDNVPNSRLVLKTSTQDDPDTQELLTRRMLRQNLDISRITWLPRTHSAADHLNQYSLIDIALDCFPNGGCTTTCEALWMGVPVITLTGSSYVSRMSTAVLSGANLNHLCADTLEEYINRGVSLASEVNTLRSNRHQWRSAILDSELGDSNDLLSHLEAAFSELFNMS